MANVVKIQLTEDAPMLLIKSTCTHYKLVKFDDRTILQKLKVQPTVTSLICEISISSRSIYKVIQDFWWLLIVALGLAKANAANEPNTGILFIYLHKTKRKTTSYNNLSGREQHSRKQVHMQYTCKHFNIS